MKSNWSDKQAEEYRSRFGEAWGDTLALRTYTSRLLGRETGLVLHGGGNTSVKGTVTTILGSEVPALFVKASGRDLEMIEPEEHTALALDALMPLRALDHCPDDAMVNELRRHRLDAGALTPSIEALMHAFLPPRYIDHTHADAILALTNRADGANIVREALGDSVIVLDYVKPGFALAKAAADAFDRHPGADGMVLLKHGLVTWGDDAREAYEKTIALVTQAEEYCVSRTKPRAARPAAVSIDEALARYDTVAPILRGICAEATGDPDRPHNRFILRSVITDELLALLDSKEGRDLLDTPPLTADHLIKTKPRPLWIDALPFDNKPALWKQLSDAVERYSRRYERYVNAYSSTLAPGVVPFDSAPRVLFIRGLGAICLGRTVIEADIVRDITIHTVAVKQAAAALGDYEGLGEEHLFDMEYFSLQHAKIERFHGRPLARTIAMITGAAGAIGSGISEALLAAGCHVAVTDLAGDALDLLVAELTQRFGGRVIGIPIDVTERDSVVRGFREIVRQWGGIDLVIPNAGCAHVSSLAEMEEETFRSLERVNIEGTLHVIAEAAHIFKEQGTGGDIVLVSTKNVFSPGARFGAYSATKAASHQLARVASLELAEEDVRVNMVSPDAVFAHGKRSSGLWAEVGPDRMRARGLDEQGMKEYYRNRNLLKTAVTAEHVARAVLFFATRQTPTTGATIPVDGGLPDSTPR